MAKYDFKGIKRWGARGILGALATTGWGTWLTTTPIVRRIVEVAVEYLTNWLANKGLIVFNLGAIYVEGELDQKAFDSAIEEALKAAQVGGLSPAQEKAIDDKVIEAFRKFAVFRTGQ